MIRMRSVGLVIAACFLAGVASSAGLGAQGKSGSPSSSSAKAPVDIQVVVRTPDGKPIGDLGTKDFDVRIGQRRIPVLIGSPQYRERSSRRVATHLLVVLGRDVAVSPEYQGKLVEALRLVFRQGWKVAVGQAGQDATNYVSSAATLKSALAAQRRGLPTDAVISKLNQLSGRRVLLLVPSETNRLDRILGESQIKSAKDALVDIFDVDGGHEVDSPVQAQDPESSANRPREAEQYPLAGAPMSLKWSEKAEVFSNGLFHEPSLAGAVRSAEHAGLGYYILSVNSSALPQPLGANTLLLKVNRRPPILVLAQPSDDTSELRVKLAIR